MVAEMAPDGRAVNPARFIAITRARCIARYKMHSIPGRPEELETNSVIQGSFLSPNPQDRSIGKRTISFAYAGGEMRIRKHGGPTNRDWVEVRDFQLREGWLNEVYAFLDQFLGYPKAALFTTSKLIPGRPRPIQDDPQA